MDPAQFPAWIQAGGVVAFAGAVWFELRGQRKTIERLAALVYALLERDRMRHGDTGPIAIPRTITESNPPPYKR